MLVAPTPFTEVPSTATVMLVPAANGLPFWSVTVIRYVWPTATVAGLIVKMGKPEKISGVRPMTVAWFRSEVVAVTTATPSAGRGLAERRVTEP